MLKKLVDWLGLLDIERIELLCNPSGSKEVARATGTAAVLTDTTEVVDSQENPELVRTSHICLRPPICLPQLMGQQ